MLQSDIRNLILLNMDKARLEVVEQVISWLGANPKRRDALVKKTPISTHTLRQLEQGSYIPGETLGNALRYAMERIDRASSKKASGEPPSAA